MTQPFPSFSIAPEAVAVLADELRSLAGELTEDADLSRSTATSFPIALGGDEGWTAACAATAWGSLQEVLADRSRAVADTFDAAVAAYRAEDAALAGRVGHGHPPAEGAPR
jgi:hypothetical protein